MLRRGIRHAADYLVAAPRDFLLRQFVIIRSTAHHQLRQFSELLLSGFHSLCLMPQVAFLKTMALSHRRSCPRPVLPIVKCVSSETKVRTFIRSLSSSAYLLTAL